MITTEAKQALWLRAEAALDSVRAYLQSDGGNVRIHDLSDDLTLTLALEGNCRTCSMSAMTMRAGIEEAIRKAVPEITRVEALA